MTTTYTNSKGQKVEIETMLTPHLKNAHAKAVRTEEELREEYPQHHDTEREAEIEAMRVEIEKRDAEYAAQQEAEGGN